jgi:cytochrome c-type biogenesis protein CcmF
MRDFAAHGGDIGNAALMLVFAVAIYSIGAALAGAWTRRESLVRSAENGVLCIFGLTVLASGSLVALFLTDSFGIEYVAGHSNRALPLFYKIAALWAGQEGSLLFWSLVLCLYAAIVIVQNRRENRDLMPYVVPLLLGTILFFNVLNLFVANPFSEIGLTNADGSVRLVKPPDGNGLNPLLQHPAMVIHPPILYLGYVGFAIPAAFAMAALWRKQRGSRWIQTTRRWTLVAWMFQGTGLLLGGRWAYAELGWGGYWAWDPVENASLMPWITATAFLHSVIVQERKGMLKVWNMALVMLTYGLCIFGTFLTRSGIVSSVHAFAQSTIGPWFVGFLTILTVSSGALIISRLEYLKSERELDSVLSRESSFLFNNLILLAAAFAVLWGTIFPVISEAVRGVQITVGAPYFNKINVPIGLFLLFLTGVGPLFAWRKTSLPSLKRNFAIPAIVGLVTFGIAFALGLRHFYGLVSLAISGFVAATIVSEFSRGVSARMQTTSENALVALVNLVRRHKRRYGGYIVHLAIVLIFVGFTGQAFDFETRGEMLPGDRMSVRGYELVLDDLTESDNANYSSGLATVSVYKDGKPLATMSPEKRFYKSSQQPTSEVAIHSTLFEDLYVVYLGSGENGRALIQVYLNPLVTWVWIGAVVMFLGTILTIVPERRTTRPEAVAVPSALGLGRYGVET